jgi:hypothetical protein
MSSIHISKLYRRLVRSPKYIRTTGIYLHEQWLEVIFRHCGLVRGN